jgi:hypothetical protein
MTLALRIGMGVAAVVVMAIVTDECRGGAAELSKQEEPRGTRSRLSPEVSS